MYVLNYSGNLLTTGKGGGIIISDAEDEECLTEEYKATDG